MTSPVLLIYRASRLLSCNNLQIPKHHIWIFSRPFLTSHILNRGKGLHRIKKEHGNLKNEVRSSKDNCEVSICNVFNHVLNFQTQMIVNIYGSKILIIKSFCVYCLLDINDTMQNHIRNKNLLPNNIFNTNTTIVIISFLHFISRSAKKLKN